MDTRRHIMILGILVSFGMVSLPPSAPALSISDFVGPRTASSNTAATRAAGQPANGQVYGPLPAATSRAAVPSGSFVPAPPLSAPVPAAKVNQAAVPEVITPPDAYINNERVVLITAPPVLLPKVAKHIVVRPFLTISMLLTNNFDNPGPSQGYSSGNAKVFHVFDSNGDLKRIEQYVFDPKTGNLAGISTQFFDTQTGMLWDIHKEIFDVKTGRLVGWDVFQPFGPQQRFLRTSCRMFDKKTGIVNMWTSWDYDPAGNLMRIFHKAKNGEPFLIEYYANGKLLRKESRQPDLSKGQVLGPITAAERLRDRRPLL